jgi:D-ribose pyranase
MLRNGILNPHINSLLARVRHTNMLVIADRGFAYWPAIETVDISLADGIPTVLQVLEAIRDNFDIVEIYMAREFSQENTPETQERFAKATAGVAVKFEPHAELKKRVPQAIGLIRTGDTTQYANMVLVSGRL